jgi:hypothetical protein
MPAPITMPTMIATASLPRSSARAVLDCANRSSFLGTT